MKKLWADSAINPRFGQRTHINTTLPAFRGTVNIPFAVALLEQMTAWGPPVQLKAVLLNGEWQLLVRTSDLNDFWKRLVELQRASR